ncbi:MFS transporter [Paenibacillus barcinonensis]|uniref:MFS transporter n=1 Tax=Paenibacillus barcinonensis TaxID=198119 RepID=A0A2V4VAU6_PAEBA|nr:MFS transporter [Paenibacillus barcinonensis]PYE50236.1 putative MFS family arabinose efflux permease [Paenibacillus barcinonensis]QKS54927.1 MFS transporter [Paenibacillus barcinonensis]
MQTPLQNSQLSTPKKQGITRTLAWVFAVCSGLSVANIYYAQPLLDSIARDFDLSTGVIGIVITVTQIWYALGLLLLVPLGDLIPPRKLIIVQMCLSAVALLGAGTAASHAVLFTALAAIGLLAVITQTFVAYAAHLSAESERGAIVGRVTSGIVIGILLARTVAGVMNDWLGWRSVYLLSASLTLISVVVLIHMLPKQSSSPSKLSYLQLLRSTLQLYAELRILRIRGLLAMLIFAAFSMFWTSIVLPLSAPPISLSHSAIGAMGFAGIAGALAAAKAGKQADRGYGQRTTGLALVILVLSWACIGMLHTSLWFLIVGIIVLDLAVQAVHVTNQSLIYQVRPEAQSRLTASYMIFYSIGSAAGSIISTQGYAYAGWTGVCWSGAAVSTLALLVWLIDRKSDCLA